MNVMNFFSDDLSKKPEKCKDRFVKTFVDLPKYNALIKSILIKKEFIFDSIDTSPSALMWLYLYRYSFYFKQEGQRAMFARRYSHYLEETSYFFDAVKLNKEYLEVIRTNDLLKLTEYANKGREYTRNKRIENTLSMGQNAKAYFDIELYNILSNMLKNSNVFTKDNNRYYSTEEVTICLDSSDDHYKVFKIYDKTVKEVIEWLGLELLCKIGTGTFINGMGLIGYDADTLILHKTAFLN